MSREIGDGEDMEPMLSSIETRFPEHFIGWGHARGEYLLVHRRSMRVVASSRVLESIMAATRLLA